MMTESLLRVLSYEQAHLLPHNDACRICATWHEPHEPHNAASWRYQSWFADRERGLGRVPRQATWRDAAAHCDPVTRQRWQELLMTCGIDASLVIEGSGHTST